MDENKILNFADIMEKREKTKNQNVCAWSTALLAFEEISFEINRIMQFLYKSVEHWDGDAVLEGLTESELFKMQYLFIHHGKNLLFLGEKLCELVPEYSVEDMAELIEEIEQDQKEYNAGCMSIIEKKIREFDSLMSVDTTE